MKELPDEVLARLEDPASKFNFGWSHGRETLRDGRPDTYKGSFYANPMLDSVTEDPVLQAAYPAYCRPNIWPTQPLPGLEPALKECGRLMVAAGLLLAARCDDLMAERVPTGGVGSQERRPSGDPSLRASLAASLCHKARLLHYFAVPAGEAGQGEDDSWCGWHTDHGSLTALCAAQYLDGRGGGAADPGAGAGGAGLHVRTRGGEVVRVDIPPDCLAFQLGEAAEVASGGVLAATTHCVVAPDSGAAAADFTRETFAVFMQPRWDEALDCPPTCECRLTVGQWRPGMTFGQFAEATFAQYYS